MSYVIEDLSMNLKKKTDLEGIKIEILKYLEISIDDSMWKIRQFIKENSVYSLGKAIEESKRLTDLIITYDLVERKAYSLEDIVEYVDEVLCVRKDEEGYWFGYDCKDEYGIIIKQLQNKNSF